MTNEKMFSHEYWKHHHLIHIHSRSYHGLIKGDTCFKSHGFQKQKYRTYPSFVVNDYLHRNRINSIKLRSGCSNRHIRVSSRSKYRIRDNEIFKIINRVRKRERMCKKYKEDWWYSNE